MPMEALRFEGSKINCFPRDLSSRVMCYIAGNSWNLAVKLMTVVGQHSQVKKQLPSEVRDFAMLPAQRFWQETVSLLAVMWPWSPQWECTFLGKNFQLKNKNHCFIFLIAFENNNSCKISVPDWVYYGGFQNSQLRHMLPRLPLMQCNHNNASGIPKRFKDHSVTCDYGHSFILFFIILSSSLPV